MLKPVKFEELKQSLDKHSSLQVSPLPQSFLDELKSQTRTYKKRFLVKFGRHIQFKHTPEIGLFEADGHLCHIYEVKTGKKYLIDHTLEELEGELLNPEKFFRISRKHIINIDAIKDVSIHNTCIVKASFPYEESLNVSRGRMKDFKNWIDA